jgi:peptide/nickel transport system substrate-binding protein
VLSLDEPYAPFLQATTLGLLPSHLLSDVRPSELLTHRFSTLDPVGSGPYRLAQPGGLTDDEIRLARWDGHPDASENRPFLDEIRIRVHDSRAAALESLAQLDVQTLGDVPADAFDMLGEDARLYTAVEAGYTLVYLNDSDDVFTDPAVRKALSLGLDREGIIHDPDVLAGQGVAAASPIAPGSWAYDPSVRPVHYNLEAAAAILEEAGWRDSDGDGLRDRDGRNLTFSLEASNDPLLVAIADRIAADWERIGVGTTRRNLDQQSTVSNLTHRAYDAMLFGWERRDYDPDPYPLWHSSQATNGQNYAGWRNSDADALMVRARKAHPDDLEGRAALYHQFQRLFAEDEPALMLFHPVYTYAVADPSLGGVQMPQLLSAPSDRFLTLPNWFVQTERVFLGDSQSRRGTPEP